MRRHARSSAGRAAPVRSGSRAAHLMEGLEARRLLNAADLDDTFGIDGRYLANDALQDVAAASKRQTDGKLVVAGASITNVATLDFAFLVQRFNEDGTLDTGFGTGGQVNTEF